MGSAWRASWAPAAPVGLRIGPGLLRSRRAALGSHPCARPGLSHLAPPALIACAPQRGANRKHAGILRSLEVSMAAARSKVGILQPGCPRIALASCPARAAQRLTDHSSVRRQCLAFLRQPELSAPVGGRAPGLRSEGSWLAAELLRAGLEPGVLDRCAGWTGYCPSSPAQGAPPPARPACAAARARTPALPVPARHGPSFAPVILTWRLQRMPACFLFAPL